MRSPMIPLSRVMTGSAALAVIAGLCLGVPSAGADEPPSDTARALSGTDRPLPAALRKASGPVSVMLELDAAPAATVYAASGGLSPRGRSLASRAAVERVELLADSVRARLAAPSTRGTVLFEVSRTYAGIAVRTDASRLDALKDLPGVKAVHHLVPKQRDNFIAVPLVDAPATWVATGKTGEGVTIGIIDTGIDYTHANFGGPGTVGAYEAALAVKEAGDAPVYPQPSKVAGGYDFAGNAYDATEPDTSTPDPDPNPLDCVYTSDTVGHGTHVAGTAGGYGVAADGSTYAGPWNGDTPFDTMAIGPGVAPEATLYALKVFGCQGTTNLVVEALDWAADPNGDGDLADHLDVVNMSLGSSFGSPQDPDSVASNNAVDVGIVVVASAGNSGDLYEVSGSPGNAVKALSVAASQDRGEITDGFVATIGSVPSTFPASLSADYPWQTAPGVADAAVAELGDWGADPSDGNNIDGCSELSASDAAKVNGKIALLWWEDNDGTRRCGSAVRSTNVASAGAVGAILASSTFLFEAGIAGIAEIPVVLANTEGSQALHSALLAGTPVTATLDNSLRNAERIIIPPGPNDPTDSLASFTSRGTALAGNVKPDVSAPGASIFSSASGTGSQGVSYSGTSMAAPMTAGLAALVVGARPTWSASEVKAGIMNTAAHDLFRDPGRSGPRYDVLRAGAGRIDALSATRSRLLAYVTDDPGAVSVSFGVLNVARTVTKTKTVQISDKRTSGAKRAYAVGLQRIRVLPGATFSVSPAQVVLRPGQSKSVTVTLSVDARKLVHRADPTLNLDPTGFGLMPDFLTDVSGLVTVTNPSGVTLARVPVFAAPRPVSAIYVPADDIVTKVSGDLKTGTLTLSGTGLDHAGAQPYERELSRLSALQLVGESPRLPKCGPTVGTSSSCWTTADEASADLRYFGVTSSARLVPDPLSATEGAKAYFGVVSWSPWRTAASIAEFDVFLDTDNDGTEDAVAFNTRLGETDIFVVNVISLRAGEVGALIDAQLINNGLGNEETAKMHSSVMALPVSLGALANPTDDELNPLPPFISPGQTTVSYWVESYAGSILGPVDTVGSRESPLQIDLVAPPLTAFDSAGTLPVPAEPGGTLAVTFDPATAGPNPRLLLLHHLNALSKKAEVVSVS